MPRPPEIETAQGGEADHCARMNRPLHPPELGERVEHREHRHHRYRPSFATSCPKRNSSEISVSAAMNSGPVKRARKSLWSYLRCMWNMTTIMNLSAGSMRRSGTKTRDATSAGM